MRKLLRKFTGGLLVKEFILSILFVLEEDPPGENIKSLEGFLFPDTYRFF